jgi:hypothetical protein
METNKKKRVPCICKGNFRKIMHRYKQFITKTYVDKNGVYYHFSGILHTGDMYYYYMWNEKEAKCLSCIGTIDHLINQIEPTIESYGYTRVSEFSPEQPAL